MDGSNPAAMPVPAGTTVTRWPGALSGLVGAAVALGSAEVFSGLAGDAVPSPVVAVADVVVDKAPGSAVRVGIDLLGTADKPVLIVGVVVVSAALAALVGARAAVRRAVGRPSAAAVAALLGAFAAVAFLAANRQATASPLGSLVAYAAAAMLGWLTTWMLFAAGVARAAQEARSTEPGFATPIDPPATRRQFLGLAGAGVAFAGLAAAGGSRLRSASAVTTERAALQLPVPASAVPTVAGALDGVVPGISPYIVPASDFYRIDTALLVPQVRADGWQLRIDGLVEREITLSFEELTAMTVVEAPVTLSCVSNEVGGNLVGNAVWRGVPLRDVLDLAGVKPDATQLASSSVDGWTCGFPVEAAFDGRDALVAFGMNGEPLTAEHGFPVRLVVPGLYGYVSATKWLNRLHLTRWEDFSGYWIPRGWSAQGPIKTQSRIDVPRNAATVAPGTVAVAGVAWAPTRGIAKVEVRVDEGEWQPARLGGVLSEDTWVQWVFEWDATPGKHLLQVRATDGTGAAQTGEFAPPAPDGATGWHAIGVIVE